jgi:hypothetical protein
MDYYSNINGALLSEPDCDFEEPTAEEIAALQAEYAYENWQAEQSYEQHLKEERAAYQLRQIGLAPSMVRTIDLSIPF